MKTVTFKCLENIRSIFDNHKADEIETLLIDQIGRYAEKDWINESAHSPDAVKAYDNFSPMVWQEFKNLKHLSISIEFSCLSILSYLPKLETLNIKIIFHTSFLSKFKKIILPNLKHLNIDFVSNDTPINIITILEDIMPPVEITKNLTSFSLKSTRNYNIEPILIRDLKFLKNAVNLRTLSLTECNLKNWKILSVCKNLISLDLRDVRAAEGETALPLLPKLENLSLTNIIQAQQIISNTPPLLSVTSLKIFNAYLGKTINLNSINSIFPNLKIFSCSAYNIKSFSSLPLMAKLESVDVIGATYTNDPGNSIFIDLKDLVKQPKLSSINFNIYGFKDWIGWGNYMSTLFTLANLNLTKNISITSNDKTFDKHLERLINSRKTVGFYNAVSYGISKGIDVTKNKAIDGFRSGVDKSKKIIRSCTIQ
ncbi:MAG: hypothetical protein J0H68_09135 [Sphingobacteriia bacterium]|nr:hypothetical protein [Sphingobacteriia bacterium]